MSTAREMQRHKDKFYRAIAKAKLMETEVEKWKAVVGVAEKELVSAVAEIVALKADVEKMRAEHQSEVDGLHATLIEMRDELAVEHARWDWMEAGGNVHRSHGRWAAHGSMFSPDGGGPYRYAATPREAIDMAMKGEAS